ncbi:MULTISPECIES: glutaredoxin domain-containing protein [unclassified Streptomyces]|uniref:glutaredoxin domain-containing protein n=1 Tax=unclassified Streptomyces TaxID=2593676 RepID=UPI000450EA37|nr:glutaredoxin domain-containing protein [Streptomyces sp. PCS3-D2]WKV72960.1 NrdH-redoxin [Streptomyces sp. PCS3-D2]
MERFVSKGSGRGAVTVYWRPGCVFCIKLFTQLRLARIPYRKVDIWRDPDAAAFVRGVADGNETVPTVVVADHPPMVNPSLARIRAALADD